jgi:N-acetylglucosaminylphosphatidylinositol deacetylase
MAGTTTVVTLLLAPVLIFFLWHMTASAIPPVPSNLRNKRIILLIAHPDDESMFFSPTLQALTHPSLSNHLKILCMSTGDSEGLGETRRKEIEAAAVTLGVRRREDVFVLNDDRFKDGMNETWRPEEIVRVLASAFAPHLNSTLPTGATVGKDSEAPPATTSPEKEKEKEKEKDRRKSKGPKHSKTASSSASAPPPPPQNPAGPRATIDVLITFDAQGISSHPNHIALYHGARQFIQSIMKGHSGYACPVALYTLPTVNLARKYSFILDAVPTLLSGIYGSIFGNLAKNSNKPTITSTESKKDTAADRTVFVNDIPRYWKAREAMVSGHKSQMVWFRWGWIALGRYMVVNDLRNERVIAT